MAEKLFLFNCLFFLTLSTPVFARDIDILQCRLNQAGSFYAHFTQKVAMANNDLLQEGHGELWIKPPNLFKWCMQEPDENVLISDGELLWFYNPAIEQVTVSSLQHVIIHTPLTLLLQKSKSNIFKYTVKRKGDNFLVKTKSNQNNIECFTIQITKDGTIIRFAVFEKNGQRNIYELKNHIKKPIQDSTFRFNPPINVTIDDQRQ